MAIENDEKETGPVAWENQASVPLSALKHAASNAAQDDQDADAASHASLNRDAQGLPLGRFSGRKDFQQIVRDAFSRAAEEGWNELFISDATFEDWPLAERAVADALQAWSRSGRRFTMLAKRYDEVERRHARFVTWRRTWGHIIECRSCSAADPLELPSAIWSPGWVMYRLDLERSTGICGTEPERRVLLRESLDEWLRKSAPGFPATKLGL